MNHPKLAQNLGENDREALVRDHTWEAKIVDQHLLRYRTTQVIARPPIVGPSDRRHWMIFLGCDLGQLNRFDRLNRSVTCLASRRW